MKKTFGLLLVALFFIACKKEDVEPEKTCLHVETTEVYLGQSTLDWVDLDLSPAVGKNYAQVTLRLTNYSSGGILAIFRQNGDPTDYKIGNDIDNMTSLSPYSAGQAIIYTDEFGVIEWKANFVRDVKVEVLSYIK